MTTKPLVNKHSISTSVGELDIYQASELRVLVQSPPDFTFRGRSVSFTCTLEAAEMWDWDTDGAVPYSEGWGIVRPSIGYEESEELPYWESGVFLSEIAEAAREGYLAFITRYPQWLKLCALRGARNRYNALRDYLNKDPLNEVARGNLRKLAGEIKLIEANLAKSLS